MTRSASLAAAAYLAITLALTWPLALRLASGVAGEWNTSLPSVWAMASVSEKLTHFLTGRGTTVANFWDANIFYPAPRALLYSEHLTGLSLLMLPVWWITGNGLLIFNIAVIASGVLTGLGTFLVIRAYAGGFAAPFVAGLFSAFMMTRLARDDFALLSIQWLPFAMLAWHHYVERGTWTWLALTVLCAGLLNASSTTYLWISMPLLLGFAVVDLVLQRRVRQLDRWLGLAIAVPAVALLSAPFILPGAALERQNAVTSAAAATIPTEAGSSRAVFDGPRVQAPPAYLEPTVTPPAIYRAVQALASDAVLVEFPFGNETYELRYMFFSTVHGRRLMNGSGASLPPSYLARARVLANPLLDPEQSVRAIAGATHVVVHGRAWSDDTGVRIARWLESIGGHVVPTSGEALLYQIEAPERFASRP